LTAFIERNNRGQKVGAIFTRDDNRAVSFHKCHERVGCAKIDTDDAFCH
jgi:hypothetical protein